MSCSICCRWSARPGRAVAGHSVDPVEHPAHVEIIDRGEGCLAADPRHGDLLASGMT
jgi:hypothetical protein